MRVIALYGARRRVFAGGIFAAVLLIQTGLDCRVCGDVAAYSWPGGFVSEYVHEYDGRMTGIMCVCFYKQIPRERERGTRRVVFIAIIVRSRTRVIIM